MYVLGLNVSHDASLCLLKDGEIELFHKEERLSGTKKDPQIYKSLTDLISRSYHVDEIVVSGLNFQIIRSSRIYNTDVEQLKQFLHENFPNARVTFMTEEHHLCHAAGVFYNSGFESALIFTIDGSGSIYDGTLHECETVFTGAYPCEFKTLYKNFYNSHYAGSSKQLDCDYEYNTDSKLGIVTTYCTATSLIGQHILENGKTMGLSAYGRDLEFGSLFENDRPNSNLFTTYASYAPHLLLHVDYVNKKITNVTPENYQLYADYAYQVQKQTQQQVLNLVTKWIDKTGITNVCLTGGYGLNVVCNEFLIKSLPHVNFFFEPLADDTGNSIGAAKYRYHQLTGDTTVRELKHTFFNGGPHILKDVGVPATVDDVVSLLQEQKTVAVFNGLAEAGPRALGNRSILFDPRNKNGKEIVNRIKKREWYRPFAAMILQEHFDEYFETLGWNKSEFMTVSFQCKHPELIPAVIHVDNSCRIQTVDKSIPHVYNILYKFHERTGCPVLLNTSFNMAGDPLIETQKQAIDCLNNSELDALWFPEIGRLLT